MARKPPKRSFLWQGALILLPVLLLALGSLASLRWDEESAERDARQKAVQSLRSLSAVLGYTANRELQRFKALNDKWTTEQLYNWIQADMKVEADNQLMSDIAKWESDYPGLKLADLATRMGVVDRDGSQPYPPEEPLAPVPPKWFRDLSFEQRGLWNALREKVDDNDDYGPAHMAFVDSGVPPEARAAATNLERELTYRVIGPGPPSGAGYSESGISFSGIALERILSIPGVRLSHSTQQALWSEIIQTPSFEAPTLLKMAEVRTNGADSVFCDKLWRVRELWQIQSKECEWLAPLRRAPELRQAWEQTNLWCRWVSGTAGEALAFNSPMKSRDSIQGQAIYFLPRRVLEAVFDKALAENKFLVPVFAGVGLTVEGETFAAPQHSRNPEPELMETASGKFGDPVTSDVAKFEVKVFLTSKEQMLSTERQRARLFGLLIFGAVAAALIGFVMARRAFTTQLQLSDAKSNFVSSVSHELRAPIASVRLMAESLERGKISEAQKQNEYFQFIVQECRRLSSLIENVLDFSRIEQGRKEYEFEPTDLAALVRETVKLMEPYAAEKGVVLKTSNIEHRTSNIELEVDGRAVQQALVNLMDNAIKHSPKGAAVEVGFECNEAHVRLWVEDNGPGIPPEEQERIFERFYRLGSELRRETQGVGIGLSIVRHIVEAHGGKVTVRSSVGHGSRFTIELPANNRTADKPR